MAGKIKAKKTEEKQSFVALVPITADLSTYDEADNFSCSVALLLLYCDFYRV